MTHFANVMGLQLFAPIKMYSENKKLFYDSEWLKRQPNKINVPIGQYEIVCESYKPVTPLRYNFPALPKAERNLIKPSISISYGINPNKCTVNHLTGEILFDYQFIDAPEYVIQFILLHEIGHNYYKTEKHADTYACYTMLKNGYNKIQCLRAILFALENNPERKINILNYINSLTYAAR